MPNLKTHIYIGLFTYPAAYLSIGYGISQMPSLNFSPLFDIQTITLGYFVYVIGSDLPDIDSRNAPIHHFLKILASILGVFIALNWSNKWISKEFKDTNIHFLALSAVILLSAFIFYILITLVLKLHIFDHRKFAHSISFAFIYAFLLWLGFSNKSSDAIFIAALGFLGVLVHLIADFVQDIKKGNKNKALKLW